MIPALAGEGLVDAVDGFCERIAFTPDEIARVFAAARRAGSRSSCTRINCRTRRRRARGRVRRTVGRSSRICRRGGRCGDGEGRRRRGPAARRLLCAARDAGAAGRPHAQASRADGRRHRLQSRHVAADVAAARAQHGARLCSGSPSTNASPAPPATRRARSASPMRPERSKPANGPISRYGTSSVRPSSSIGSASTRCTRASGGDNDRHYRAPARPRSPTGGRSGAGAGVRSTRPRAGVAASAAAVERILARGEPVYGINTGFGKLAGVRIAAADLPQLQRNIVLSHAAGVGETRSVATTRLMMALKLGSLAQGASGVRPQTIALLEAMLARGVTPVVPSQGSVGASGDLAPLAHMAAAMIGVGEARVGDRVAPAAAALAEVGLEPITLAQGGARAAQRHAVLDRQCARRPVQGRDAVPLRPGRPARCRPTARADRIRRSTRASMRCGATRPDRESPPRCARCSPAALFARRISSATKGCRIPIACAASRR